MKLTKAQLKDIRQKFKEERTLEDPESEASYSVSHEDRRAIRSAKNSEKISVTWNINEGDLVYLPDASVGLIVKVENLSGQGGTLDVSGMYKGQEKAAIREAKQRARCYVITPKGKVWYNPSKLKKIDS